MVGENRWTKQASLDRSYVKTLFSVNIYYPNVSYYVLIHLLWIFELKKLNEMLTVENKMVELLLLLPLLWVMGFSGGGPRENPRSLSSPKAEKLDFQKYSFFGQTD